MSSHRVTLVFAACFSLVSPVCVSVQSCHRFFSIVKEDGHRTGVRQCREDERPPQLSVARMNGHHSAGTNPSSTHKPRRWYCATAYTEMDTHAIDSHTATANAYRVLSIITLGMMYAAAASPSAVTIVVERDMAYLQDNLASMISRTVT
jgi:hypothetical protein